MKRLRLIPTLLAAFTTLRSFSIGDPRIKGRIHFIMGLDALDAGKLARALTHLRRAVDLEPELSKARLALGKGLLEMAEPEEAMEHLQIVLETEPANAEAQLALAASMAMDRLQRKGALPEAEPSPPN